MNDAIQTLPALSPMLPTLSSIIPAGAEWRYELKFDGYRAILYCSNDGVQIVSRNGHLYNSLFPEIVEAFLRLSPHLQEQLPLILDGELCILASPVKADFSLIQHRGRLRSPEKIARAASDKPATFICFDLLYLKGKDLRRESYLDRKRRLEHLLDSLAQPQSRSRVPFPSISWAKPYDHPDALWETVIANDAEGIVAKRVSSVWQSGKRTTDWLKIKNYKVATCFITGYDKQNGYFHVGVLRDREVYPVGLFSHGLREAERRALVEIIKNNKTEESGSMVKMEPSLCVDIKFLEVYKQQLREPRFTGFRTDVYWEDCTWSKLINSDRRST
ncbi:DNA polymerase LigD, ligase domain protein [Caldalkalibacillus thermarum TA2.A1]|uniref:DNA ligase (ATP) n=1 Tax=Caldalkalibacillus thermarum (strain TA2.A1) TaxID=986075 RepID=F5L6D5_CALTT|nr:non-homologous end-joining DNA ligase [Caldalkalibacillus thermarum]EGL83088.1 DNA polymerase LigD, ligase domain protein [Caldalkalibacillus thermarum TA2.A1]